MQGQNKMKKGDSKMQNINHELSSEDRAVMQQILSDLNDQYDEQLNAARKRLSEAEHERNRAAHEVARLSRHQKNIAKAHKKHNTQIERVKL